MRNPATRVALACIEAQVRAEFPAQAYLEADPEPEHYCANLRRPVRMPECTALVIVADAQAFARCLACGQGQRLAAQSPYRPRPRTVALPRRDIPAEDPRMIELATALRALTADGRIRVSLLDLMRAMRVPQFEEAMRLVLRAGLTHGRPFGSVPAIAVDHSMRSFIERFAGLVVANISQPEQGGEA